MEQNDNFLKEDELEQSVPEKSNINYDNKIDAETDFSESQSVETEQSNQAVIDTEYTDIFDADNAITAARNCGSPKKGFKVFISALALTLALSIACAAGYYLGLNYRNFGSDNDYSVELAGKPDAENALSAEGVYNKVNPSVVGIIVYNTSAIKGYASGVVYSQDGYIITNDHIYENVPAAKFKVCTYDGKIYDASFVAGDTRSDLAVLKIDSNGFIPATFGNSDELNYGERVYAIGRPNDATAASSLTGGYISFLNRRVSNSTNYTSKLIQTDAAVNPGSSGGALVNAYGQVVGITSSKLVGNEYEGVGYAIPTVSMQKIVKSLIENNTVIDRARLGITYQEINMITAELEGVPQGLLIHSLSGNEDLAKKVKVGDIITSVNGIQITDADIILDIINASKPGDTITFGITTSSGGTKTVETKLIADNGGSSYVSGNLLPSDEEIEELPKN